ncbi:MAG: type IX secretion system membrane protein PorP/SprF [Bacteroidetes bacterium]|nr:type IX secretion system membrane protein PorP/SprF [Bacteroidota bacterium]
MKKLKIEDYKSVAADKLLILITNNKLKKIIYFIIVICSLSFKKVYAQQLPYYSQFKSNNYMLNPAITGTKREVDARINYRMQWVGYDDAPRTSGISIHGRFLKGKMGAGIFMMQDKVGPAKQTNLGGSYAYHLKFPDCELSAGAAANFTKYTLYGDKMILHNLQDPAVDQSINNSTWVSDANAGIYLYNDRFHVGFSILHLASSKAEFYKNDTTKKGLVPYVPHVHFTLGFNYSQNPDYIWESTLYANYVKGVPFMLDYTLRLHYQEQIFAGLSIRFKDAIAIHMGVTILEYLQISYSYDLQIGRLKNYNSGSHEIMLVYSHNPFENPRFMRRGKRFLNQRYGYLF